LYNYELKLNYDAHLIYGEYKLLSIVPKDTDEEQPLGNFVLNNKEPFPPFRNFEHLKKIIERMGTLQQQKELLKYERFGNHEIELRTKMLIDFCKQTWNEKEFVTIESTRKRKRQSPDDDSNDIKRRFESEVVEINDDNSEPIVLE